MTGPQGVCVGLHLPDFSRITGIDVWNRFAAVNNEFVPMHMQDEAGRQAGYPAAFGMGNLQWAYVHNLLRGWLDDGGAIEAVELQFRAPDTGGEMSVEGRVTAVEELPDGALRVDVELRTCGPDGSDLALGQAVVRIDTKG